MRRTAVLAVAMLALLALPHAAAAAESTATVTQSPNQLSSGQLVDQARELDGSTVTFTGEAIGEVMKRGRYAWVHLNDDAYYERNVEEGAALGGYNSGHAVWVASGLAEKIEFVGDYTHEGDIVTVSGVFNAACGQHGGDMDIHADSLEIRTAGHVVREKVHPLKAVVAATLAILAFGLWWSNRQITHREMHGLFRL